MGKASIAKGSLKKIVGSSKVKKAATAKIASPKPKKTRIEVDAVKKAADSQSCGENQELLDEIGYLLEGLHEDKPLNVRCLSIFQFAERCLTPKFLMHLRAHQTVGRIAEILKDAPSDPALSLSTATLLNVVCKDKRNTRIDETTVGVICDIFHSELRLQKSAIEKCKPFSRMKKKVNELMKTHFKITSEEFEGMEWCTKTIVAECLATLSSYHDDCAWIKDEIRIRGSFEDLISDIASEMEVLTGDGNTSKAVQLSESVKTNLFLMEKCFKVLENCTFENVMNQRQILEYKDGLLLKCMMEFFTFCENISAESCRSGRLEHGLLDCLLSCLRVMVNITNKNKYGCKLVGSKSNFLETTVNTVIRLPLLIPPDQRFDVVILGLGLFINLIEQNEENREKLAEVSVSDILQPLGNEAVKKAKSEMSQKRGSFSSTLLPVYLIDKYLKDHSSNMSGTQNETELNITSAYVSIFLGCLIKDNNDIQKRIYKHLPEGGFGELASILKEFMVFKKIAGIKMKDEDKDSIEEVIKVLVACS